MRYRTIPVKPFTLAELCAQIGKPFAFIRYGNGEWDLILGKRTQTGSGSQVFTEDLREAMRDTLRNYNGAMLGMQYPVYLKKLMLWVALTRWLSYLPEMDWYKADVLHEASERGNLSQFVRALSGHNVILAGPSHLSNLQFVDHFIEVPVRNAWGDCDTITQQLAGFRDSVILLSAGPAAKVIAHRLHGLQQGCTIIDCGSVFDPYAGVLSRKYMRNPGFVRQLCPL